MCNSSDCSLWRVTENVRFLWSSLSKGHVTIHSRYHKIFQFLEGSFPLFPYGFVIWRNGASQSWLPVIAPRSRDFPAIVTGAVSPRGSNRILIEDNTPLWVKGLSCIATLNVNSSECKFQHTPKLRCVGRHSIPSSKPLKSFDRSSVANAERTTSEVDEMLCKRRLPYSYSPALFRFKRSIASSAVGWEDKASST